DEARALVGIAARSLGSARLDVLFRLNPEVAPETLRELAVGAAGSKFGMTADELSEAVELVGGAAGLVPRGVHLHVGSQLRAVDAWRDAVRRGLALVALLGGSRPEFDTLDVGGGFPVLPRGEGAPDPARFARELPALLEAIPADRRPRRLAIEPGRALVARAGYLVARVLHVRERGGRQVVLDTGMTELIRPALYDAWHEISALTSLGRPLRDAPTVLEPTRVDGPPRRAQPAGPPTRRPRRHPRHRRLRGLARVGVQRAAAAPAGHPRGRRQAQPRAPDRTAGRPRLSSFVHSAPMGAVDTMEDFFEKLNDGDRAGAVALMDERVEMRVHVGDNARTLRGVEQVGGWFLRAEPGLKMIPGDVRDLGITYQADVLSVRPGAPSQHLDASFRVEAGRITSINLTPR